MGIRSEESPTRKNQKRLYRNRSMTNSKRTVWNWNPIKDWTEQQVFQYLEDRSIPLHPVYQYLNRFSCRLCIYMTKGDVCKVAENDPEAIEIIDNLEKEIGFTMFQNGSIRELSNHN